jgi:hypothetical protein
MHMQSIYIFRQSVLYILVTTWGSGRPPIHVEKSLDVSSTLITQINIIVNSFTWVVGGVGLGQPQVPSSADGTLRNWQHWAGSRSGSVWRERSQSVIGVQCAAEFSEI